MQKVKVKIPVREKVKSRNVNKYVKQMDTIAALENALSVAKVEATLTRGHLTGGQLAEAEKILKGQ